MKTAYAALSILLILFWAVIAIAAATQASAVSTPSWFEHVDLMSLIVWALILVVIWFLVRTLKKIDTNQALLFQKLDELCADFYTLRGEHNATKARCNQP